MEDQHRFLVGDVALHGAGSADLRRGSTGRHDHHAVFGTIGPCADRRMVLAGDPERLVDRVAGLGDLLVPTTIKRVDRLLDRQRRRVRRDKGDIAAAAVSPPAAFVTRRWLSALA
jgi:hypothetical protein